MREVWRIVRKDVDRHWPRVLALMAITAAWGWMECKLFTPNPLVGGMRALWAGCAIFLGASVIHEEALPGHNQYWLTRPYSRLRLAGAKLLFLALFEWLPVWIMGAVALAWNGLSPWRHGLRLTAETLMFAGGVGVVATALASVTENLAQLLWGAIPAIGLVSLGLIGAGARDPSGDWQWGSLEWIRLSAVGGLAMAAAAAVIAMQYRRRMAAVARMTLGAAVLMAAATPFLGSWHAAWASRSTGGNAAPRLSFAAGSQRVTGFAQTPWTPGAGDAGFNLPVRIDDLPEGAALVSERIAIEIQAPGRARWESGWRRAGGLWNRAPLVDPYVVPENGVYQEYVTVDRSFYDAVKDLPVRIHTMVAATVLGERKSVVMVTRTRNELRFEEGGCRMLPGPFGKLEVSCAWFDRVPDRSYVTAATGSGQVFAALILAESPGPISFNGSVWERAATLFTAPPMTHEMELETWRAVGRVERQLDIPSIRLADYAVRRVTDAP